MEIKGFKEFRFGLKTLETKEFKEFGSRLKTLGDQRLYKIWTRLEDPQRLRHLKRNYNAKDLMDLEKRIEAGKH